MKELTIKDKAALVDLLERHYTIKEKNFINAIASNDEERLNLTLKAYTMGAERIDTPTNVSTKTSVVAITKLYSKIQFVKAVKEVKNISLKEAKDFADELFILIEGSFGEFCSLPFIVGDSMDSKFSEEQWADVCKCLSNNMYWEYVEQTC